MLADADSGMRRSESYPGTLGPRAASLRAKAAIAVAIAAVLVIAFRWPQTPPTPPTGVSSIASRDAGSSASSLPLESMTSNDRLSILAAENVLAHENFGGENPAYGMRTNPVAWFHDVQQRDWLGQTIPTVESFRDGVAPIGRSLLRAVTILTTSGKDQPS
ncbi:hypothetical protein RMSM_04939 [Rhodopirellula maiorica SM1]|uniref:Uncharacterized protein n=1 Tax=Rhodopirellula maiorica SM1 TaxID=1265738 RepID=M5RVZ3_9BACT|nr:hypothetical protein RMSM_04939 [Rhodopirellula maiorica SM1]